MFTSSHKNSYAFEDQEWDKMESDVETDFILCVYGKPSLTIQFKEDMHPHFESHYQ